jgi:hypothetical protein
VLLGVDPHTGWEVEVRSLALQLLRCARRVYELVELRIIVVTSAAADSELTRNEEIARGVGSARNWTVGKRRRAGTRKIWIGQR